MLKIAPYLGITRMTLNLYRKDVSSMTGSDSKPR
jgi:hypothetical protein